MFKSKRKGIIILAALTVAVLLGAGAYIREAYTVRTVYVEGNVHYTEDEIKAFVMKGLLGTIPSISLLNTRIGGWRGFLLWM